MTLENAYIKFSYHAFEIFIPSTHKEINISVFEIYAYFATIYVSFTICISLLIYFLYEVST